MADRIAGIVETSQVITQAWRMQLQYYSARAENADPADSDDRIAGALATAACVVLTRAAALAGLTEEVPRAPLRESRSHLPSGTWPSAEANQIRGFDHPYVGNLTNSRSSVGTRANP